MTQEEKSLLALVRDQARALIRSLHTEERHRQSVWVGIAGLTAAVDSMERVFLEEFALSPKPEKK